MAKLYPYETKAWETITDMYGEDISYEQLKLLAEVCSIATEIKIRRKNKRTTARLIKWFDANFEEIEPFIRKTVMVKDY